MRAATRSASRSNALVAVPSSPSASGLPPISEPAPALSIVPSPARESSEDRALAGSLPSHDEIALEAYCLYLARGGADGHDVEDWLKAEERLRGRSLRRSA